jgi:Domain of unknown function (DUF4124)
MSIRLALIILFGAVAATAAGQIYRTVDANGNVVFTDIAPVDRSGQPSAQQVEIPPTNTFEPPVVQAPASSATAPSSSAGFYNELVIISPTEDESIRDNAGNVTIEVAINPPLRADHRLLLVLDGTQTEVEAQNGVFELTNVDRGTHTAGVRAVDRQGNVVTDSDPVTFHLLRVSVQQPQAAPPIVRPN